MVFFLFQLNGKMTYYTQVNAYTLTAGLIVCFSATRRLRITLL